MSDLLYLPRASSAAGREGEGSGIRNSAVSQQREHRRNENATQSVNLQVKITRPIETKLSVIQKHKGEDIEEKFR